METQEITYHAKLIADQADSMGYINYVFENLESTDIDNHYIMCVRFPNWDQSFININDTGYVKFRYVQEGVDKWYNGNTFVPYQYTNIIFLKFIHEKNKVEEITVD